LVRPCVGLVVWVCRSAWDLRVWINGRVDVLLKRWIGRRAIVCRVVPFDALVYSFVWGESLVIRIWLLRLLRLLG
jgi:hypothetical protein